MAKTIKKPVKKSGNIKIVKVDVLKERIIPIEKELSTATSPFSVILRMENLGNLSKEKRFFVITDKTKKGAVPVVIALDAIKKPLGTGFDLKDLSAILEKALD